MCKTTHLICISLLFNYSYFVGYYATPKNLDLIYSKHWAYIKTISKPLTELKPSSRFQWNNISRKRNLFFKRYSWTATNLSMNETFPHLRRFVWQQPYPFAWAGQLVWLRNQIRRSLWWPQGSRPRSSSYLWKLLKACTLKKFQVLFYVYHKYFTRKRFFKINVSVPVAHSTLGVFCRPEGVEYTAFLSDGVYHDPGGSQRVTQTISYLFLP